ncbi:MAG: hypothetical protein ACRC9R_06610 [Enterovibrio sp.]
MQQQEKSLHFDLDEISELAQLDYGVSRTNLAKAGVPAEQLDEFIEASNKLPNLQPLEGSVNNQKRQKMPHVWYAQQWPDVNARQAHLQSQAIASLPKKLNQLMNFYRERHETLLARIRSALQPASSVEAE